MTLTIGNWIFIGIVAIFGIIISIMLIYGEASVAGIITIVSTVAFCIVLMFSLSWWHNNTASGIRAMKDYQSNMNNGIMREITITAEDGREIFNYEGKCDIETSHENSENYILFESEDGRRYIIYYGVQDTVLIVEKAEN